MPSRFFVFERKNPVGVHDPLDVVGIGVREVGAASGTARTAPA